METFHHPVQLHTPMLLGAGSLDQAIPSCSLWYVKLDKGEPNGFSQAALRPMCGHICVDIFVGANHVVIAWWPGAKKKGQCCATIAAERFIFDPKPVRETHEMGSGKKIASSSSTLDDRGEILGSPEHWGHIMVIFRCRIFLVELQTRGVFEQSHLVIPQELEAKPIRCSHEAQGTGTTGLWESFFLGFGSLGV